MDGTRVTEILMAEHRGIERLERALALAPA